MNKRLVNSIEKNRERFKTLPKTLDYLINRHNSQFREQLLYLYYKQYTDRQVASHLSIHYKSYRYYLDNREQLRIDIDRHRQLGKRYKAYSKQLNNVARGKGV